MELEVTVEEDAMVPMRDGVALATDVYRPMRRGQVVETPLPVIMERTPYGKRGVSRTENSSLQRTPATRAEIAGALLHDVGKIECGLGTWGRVAASVVGGRTERFRTYQDHEHVGSRLAAAAGSDPATVELIDERGPAYATLEVCDRA